ncbi:MAG: Aspartyl-tRNA(Asn) amidotransferase subunit A @ Glutamyl-tRNA(Gln) amidotransferase subunit A, partial [uncultured Frankineae bacterium]
DRPDPPHRRRDGRRRREQGRQRRRGRPGPPRPDRRRRRRRARLPARRRRRRPGAGGPRGRGRGDRAARRGPARPQGRDRHPGRPHDGRVADPRGLAAALRRDRHDPAAGRRRGGARQDQHGRVRDGLVHRAQRLRPDAQPLGPHPDAGRQRRRLGRGGGGVRSAAGRRHRHRRLDPPARVGHRHGRGQADLRRGLALRARRVLQLAGPGRSVRPHRARRRAAARGDRRARPGRLDLDRRARPAGGGGGPPRVGAGPAGRRRARAHGRGLRGGGAGALRRGRRAAVRARRHGDRGELPPLRARPAGLLPHRAVGGVVEPRALRQRPLRPAGRRRRRPLARGGHVAHPRRGVRRRGQAPDHPRHLRPVERLLRRLLRPGAEGPHAHHARLHRRLRAGRRPGVASLAGRRLPARRQARRPARDVPPGPRDHPVEPLRRPGDVAAGGAVRGPAGGAAGHGAHHARRPALPGGRRARGRPARPMGRAAARVRTRAGGCTCL